MTAVEIRVRDAPLISASRLLAERGFYGILWVDANLRVSARYGDLVAFVGVDAPLTDSVLPFAGLESELLALWNSPQLVLDVPSVTIIANAERTPRLNLAAVWCQSEQSILVLVSRAVVSADLEVELNRQIRARLMAEADVKAKSVELQRANGELGHANADLQQFASVISHDLKAPMRELRFLADDADALLASGEIERARETLLAMRQQSRRMSDMMSSLLGYVTAAQKSEALEELDTGARAAAIIESLRRPGGLSVRLEGDWPRLMTFAALFDLVLRNLIDNALTHHDRDSGTIVVSARNDGDDVVVSVRDDGPGIAPEHRDAIFLPFRTLKTGRNGCDSGIGLSIVRRALSTVGGRIIVESDAPKSRGATFKFYWPRSLDTILKIQWTDDQTR